MEEPRTAPLRLLAQDAEDLEVISSALQDAIATVGDIEYSPARRCLTISFNRYRWESGGGERVRSAVQLGSVESVQTRRLRREVKDAVVALLAITFEPSEPPGGVVIFSFAGGGDLRASVECIDAVLADVSAPWRTPRSPAHDL